MAGSKPRVLEARRVASSDAVVVSVPRRARKISDLVPVLEVLSVLGSRVSDQKLWKEMTAELEDKMKAFRGVCSPKLEHAIRLHTKRFYEGYYDDQSEDIQYECDRLTSALVYGQYLNECIEKLNESAMMLGRTGLLTLAEKAVGDTTSALSGDFYSLSFPEISKRVRSILPQLFAALRDAGLNEYAELNERNIASMQKKVADRVEAAIHEMGDQEPEARIA